MSLEIRDNDAAWAWLTGALCLIRLGTDLGQQIGVASRHAFQMLSETGEIPPPGVFADVAALVEGSTLDRAFELPAVPDELKARLRAYEDQFLGRLAADRRMEAVADALARLPHVHRAVAVPLLVARVLERIEFKAGVTVSPGILRRTHQTSRDEICADGYATLREPGELTDAIVEGYAGLVAAARRSGKLLDDTDVFLLENLGVLDSMGQRLAIEQMVAASDALSRALPRRVKPRHARRGRMPTQIEDEDQYPTGGFASISTAGTLENLVSSELIYMEDPTSWSGDVDLFDLRYVERELLYYTRDESMFTRNHRVLTFVIHPELVRARFKDAQLDWQRLVLVFGLITCAVKRLSDWLSEDALTFRVVFLFDEGAHNPLRPELGLCELLLREWIEKEAAEVLEGDTLEAVLGLASEESRIAQSDVILFDMGEIDIPEHDPRVRVASFDVSHEIPAVTWSDRPPPHEMDTDVWTAWRTVTLDLLREMV